MEKHSANHRPSAGSAQTETKPPKNRHPWLKSLVLLLIVGLVFAAGIQVGRGNWHIRGLSPTAANQGLPSQLDYSSVDSLYQTLKGDFDGKLSEAKLLDGIKSGLIEAAGDPYTEYFDPTAASDLNDTLSGSFTGIGAELGKDKDGNIIIVSPIAGYPAAKAGLQAKDIIAAVGGEATSGWTVNQAVAKIRGPAASKVNLTIVRDLGSPFKVSITRTKISLPSVKSSVKDGIGYMKISQFTKDTVGLAQQAAKDFKAKNVKGVVVDLRNNPGGYLSGAVDIASLWLPEGKTVVSERRAGQTLSVEYASGGNVLNGIPTVILVNDGSASASEILAGALRDNNAAKLVGITTFGKGSVQKVDELPGGSELKVTIARWYTPAGKNIDKQGIKPDYKVTLSQADIKAGKDSQLDRANQIVKQLAN